MSTRTQRFYRVYLSFGYSSASLVNYQIGKTKSHQTTANLKISTKDKDLPRASQRIRVGNHFYNTGDLAKGLLSPWYISSLHEILLMLLAIDAYKKAASEASPRDYLPFCCLSVTYFKCGEYLLCVKASQQAIDRAGDHKATVINKVLPKMHQFYMNLLDWESARKHWVEYEKYLEPALASVFNEKVLEQAEKCWMLLPNEKMAKKKVMLKLPKFRQLL